MKTISPLQLIAILFLATPLSASEPFPDGMSDVWKARYHATSAAGGEDADHDGRSNAEESLAGTDPFDSTAWLWATIGSMGESEARLDVSSVAGKVYQVFAAPTPAGPWTASGTPVAATGSLTSIHSPRVGASGFYRVGVFDRDGDGDGLTDWEELQLEGFDPQQGDSFASGIPNNDFRLASEMLTALQTGLITAGISVPAAYEREGTHAVVTFSRGSSVEYPFTLFLNVSGAGNPMKSSAGVNDFTLQDASGAPVGRRLVIPVGAATVDLHIVPLADTLREVPEQVHVSIGAAVGGTVTVRDAMPTQANQAYYLAMLRPIFGTTSVGSGIAVLRLSGDHEISSVNLTFSNLNSAVSIVRIQAADGTIFGIIPASGYANHSWPIRASGSYLTDQSVLDAVCSATAELSIGTESHINGEIRGTFITSSGSHEFHPPAAPAPVAMLTGSALDRDIIRFLTQATFGPTLADIAVLQNLVASHSGDQIAAYGAWIDQQFALPSPSLLAYALAADRQEIEASAALPAEHPAYNPNFEPEFHNRRRGWMLLAAHAPDQLRERVALALSEILVVSDKDPVILEHPHGAAHYFDMLRSNSSGSYRELLEDVVTHPVMGQYLSHLSNGKPQFDAAGNVVVSPDENLARELMQLFSIGLVELHPDGSLKLGPEGLPIPTYSQQDIAEMARVLTGWSFGVINSPAASDTIVVNTNFHQGNGLRRHEAQWTYPLVAFPEYHDSGPKSLLGITIDPEQSGEQELATVLDRLASHPNTAPFVSRRLIQRLVTANPSAGYLYRVSAAYTVSGGNLAATVKAILLDPEARSLESALATAGFGKKREPLLRYFAFLRAFSGKSQLQLSDLTAFGYPADELAKFSAGTTRIRRGEFGFWPTQTPLSAPSVFNWFLPDHMPDGLLSANGLTSPEFQLLNEYSALQDTNFLSYLVYSGQFAHSVPGQELPPYDYPAGAEWVRFDLAPLAALYMAVVDTNADGLFNSADSTTFNNPLAIAMACEAVLDRIDLLLCAGSLKARHGSAPGQPRRIILDAISSHGASHNGVDIAGWHAAIMQGRIQTALWLVMSCPDFVIQK
ncbi:DUF1800 family protein [bacterium]|nr:DUF1800 family protein [bacterium]